MAELLNRLFGLKRSRFATLREWHADLPWDDLDHEALLGELLQPTHPALRQICRIIANLETAHFTPEQNAEIRALVDEAVQDESVLFFMEAIRRFPYAEALWKRSTPRVNNLRPILERATAGAVHKLAAADGAVLSIGECRDALDEVIKLYHSSASPDSMRETMTVGLCRIIRQQRDFSFSSGLERLIAAIEDHRSIGKGSQVRAVRTILQATGLSPDCAPGLRAYLREQELVAAIRRKLALAAGEELAPVLDAVFDQNTPMNDRNAAKAAAYPPFKALLDQGPEALGRHLVALIAILGSKQHLNISNWSHLQRGADGDFTVDYNYGTAERGMCNLAACMVARKVTLSDADVAKIVECAGKVQGLHTRHLLNLALRTAEAHPGGATEAALRFFAADKVTDTGLGWLPKDWMGDIRRTVEGGAAAAVAREPLKTPEIDFQRWDAGTQIMVHFGALLDARLHDARHDSWLTETLAAATLGFVPTESQVRAFRASLERMDISPHSRDRMAMNYGAPNSRAGIIAEHVTYLTGLLAAVRPHVLAQPDALRRFGEHCLSLTNKTLPSQKWRDEARALWLKIGSERGLALLGSLLDVVGTGPDGAKPAEPLLRGLVYSAAEWDPGKVAPLLAEFAQRKCYQSVPGMGIRDEKLGNACLWALIQLPEGAGVPYLARLLARVKYPKIRAKIDIALNEAAAQAGVSRATLDELCVPTHDLDAAGEVAFPLGGGQAVLALAGNRDVDIRWVTAEGKEVKAPTAAMKEDREALKDVRAAAKEIEADLATQIIRLQRIFLEDRDWPIALWRERYLEHPLLRTLSARLIWWVEESGARTSVMASHGGLADAEGRAVTPGPDARIRLWHPIEDEAEAVLAWRDRIEALRIVQPFAQAWREIYRLTDAERTTGTYSNRWAGHILKQHQAMTLARLNGWTVTHRMWVDAPNDAPWHLLLGAHGLVADYWVEGTGGDDPEVLDSTAYVYVGTDRVVFHRIAETHSGKDSAYGPDRAMPVPLAELPVVVFSEVMRHCDLFTSVASIASDPQWLDAGGDATHPNQWRRGAATAYWNSATSAELEGAGKIRRELLQRVVPRLAIGPQCSFEAQWLLVQGKRHRYRIHLGSAAVYIHATAQHVCIVPAAIGAGRDAAWLPFEGDRTLSIILSKAVLLAADDKITDPVILRQI